MSTPAPHPHNTPPDNWHEITEADFARSKYFSYSPERTEHRQFPIEWNGKTTYHSVTLLHFWDKTGLALVNEFWDNKVRYFAFGCDHAYTELGMAECRARGIYHAGRCWHVSECSKCHHVNAVDSSD